MDGLTGFDYVVLAIVGLFLLVGLARGLVTEALSLAAWLAAAVAVRLFHQPVTGMLVPTTGSEPTAAIVAFVLLFFGTLFLGRLLATTLGRTSRNSVIGPLDRLAGGAFGAAKGGILSTVLFMLILFATGVFDSRRISPDWLTESASAPYLRLAATRMIHWMEEAGGTDLPDLPRLPEGHPPVAALPDETFEPAYAPEDNQRLEELIAKGEAVEL
ncbi:CvpA family protein [Thermaurantiacus sp.]